MDEDRFAQLKKAKARQMLLKENLEKEFDLMGHPKAEKLFFLAWEYGHAHGETEVRNYYEDLIDLVR